MAFSWEQERQVTKKQNQSVSSGFSWQQPGGYNPTAGAQMGGAEAFGRAAAFQAVPTTGAIASGIAGAKGGALAGSFFGPVGAAVGGVAGAVGGGLLGAVLTSKAQEAALEIIKGDEWLNQQQARLSQARKDRPVATFAGEVAPQLLTLKPSPKTVSSAAKFAQQVLTNPKTASAVLKTPAGRAQLDDLINVSIGSSAELGTETYNQAKEGDFNAIRLVAAGTVGALISQPNRFGMKMGMRPSGEVDLTPAAEGPRRLPVRQESPAESVVDFSNRYQSPDQLPSIEMGSRPPEQLPVIQVDTPASRTGSFRYEPIESTVESRGLKLEVSQPPQSDSLPVDAPNAPRIATAEQLGTGETKTLSLAKNTANAIKDAESTFGDLPTYQVRPQQLEAAVAFATDNPAEAKRVAMEGTRPPQGLFPEDLYSAVKVIAIENSDVATLHDLATRSRLITAAKTMGQRIKALDAGLTNDPVAIVKNLQNEWRNKFADEDIITKKVQEEVKAIRKEIPAIKKNDWATFIRSIQC